MQVAYRRMLAVASREYGRRAFSRSAAGFDGLKGHCEAILNEAKQTGTYKVERVITSDMDSEVTVETADRPVTCFCSNNYLGLSNDSRLVDAAKKALDTHGNGLSSVRFICGTQDIHKELEKKIAEFHGMDDAILYAACFDANAGLFEAVLGPDDAVISDALNHASIIDGIRLCKAQRHRYNHMDLEDLEAKLQATKDCRTRMIVTDGVFSMDGDVAPLPEICALAKKYDAHVMIDECHATGFFGETGRGTEEYFKLSREEGVDIINSTLGKALGGATGGYTAGPQHVIDVLRQKSRPYLFSNTLSPPVVGASIEMFDILMKDSSLPTKVLNSTRYFREALSGAGFTLSGAPDHPIVPVMLGDARLASEFADKMLEKGVYVIGFSFPVVPKGAARIRTQISAAHTQEQLEHAVSAFTEVGKELGVIE